MKSILLIALASTGWLSTVPASGADVDGRLETPFFRFQISAADGHCEILDKKAGVTWKNAIPGAPLGRAVLLVNGARSEVELGPTTLESTSDSIQASFLPLPENTSATLRLRIKVLPDRKSLEFTFDPDPELQLQSIALLENVLTVTDSGQGCVLAPVREGLVIPANSGLAFTHRFDTYAYEGCHMAMLGLVQYGAAALLTWDDPYVAAEIRSVTNAPGNLAKQLVSPALTLTRSARSFRLQLLGPGDHVAVAKAYREIAREKGLFVGWDEKLKGHPERAKLFGAINYKLWSTLDRGMNEDSSREMSVQLNWTFPEAAQIAEHLKQDLKLDKVLFTLGGWIHRGYDNQHPDILPTAPECGGDEAFVDCARRVMAQGYLFCLHDNYQDIYRDSPSWDERFIMKSSDGKLAKGGHWAGGVAYLTCSKMALELAKRPQNLIAVKKLCDANSYFIDTTYASGLQECSDPAHPLTRADDMKWKQALSDYGRQVFGVFGSECGREWAIPHSDFFEGLTGVSGGDYHNINLTTKLGANVVPLFELVYRDTIAMYGKYEYDPHQAADYVLHHISLGRTLNYHAIPKHLYWKRAAEETEPLPIRPLSWLTCDKQPRVSSRSPMAGRPEKLSSPTTTEYSCISRTPRTPSSFKTIMRRNRDHPGGTVRAPGTVHGQRARRVGRFFNVLIGMFRPVDDQRAVLLGRDNGQRDYLVGKLSVTADKIEFQSLTGSALASGRNPALFTRADNGWAAGMHSMDRFVKNTYEVLSPLNELTSRVPMTGHTFLTPDRKVQRTTFGEGRAAVIVIVNEGDTDFACDSRVGGKLRLPPNGFLIDSPYFAAFYARDWNGVVYEEPTLFTLRSLDARPLGKSRKVRIFHGFGEDQIRVRKTLLRVQREKVLNP